MDAPGDYSLRVYNKETPRELIIMVMKPVGGGEGRGEGFFAMCSCKGNSFCNFSIFSDSLCIGHFIGVSDILSVTLGVLGV